MSKHWNPRRPSVAMRPSRIRREPVRREPVRLLSEAELRKAEARAREREVWGGVAGMSLFAAGIAFLAIGIGVATVFAYGPKDAAKSARFEQCYNADGADCVADGDSIYVAGEKVAIAGIKAPLISAAQCEAERSRGIDSAMRLAELLNSGNVTVSRAFRDEAGRTVRKVLVNGRDVAETMIGADLARRIGTSEPDWCAAPSEEDTSSDA